MRTEFKQLVDSLSSAHDFTQLTSILKDQTEQSIASFISEVYDLLLVLERWAWQVFNQEISPYEELLSTLVMFNKQMIFIDDNIEETTKYSLLLPETVDQIYPLLERVKASTNDSDSFIALLSTWFDNLSMLVNEYSQLGNHPIILQMNQYIIENFVMNDSFATYVIQLQELQLSSSIFTNRQRFYTRTCSLSLKAFLCAKPQNYDTTIDKILEKNGSHYLQVIRTHCHSVHSWSRELLSSITCLTGLICACCYASKEMSNKAMFPDEQILFEYLDELVDIISYDPFYRECRMILCNDESLMLDIVLFFLMNIIQMQTLNWYFRLTDRLSDILLSKTIDLTLPFRYLSYIYSILGELLSEEKLKELKFNDQMGSSYFDMLQQAWRNPSRTFKHVPVSLLLRGYLTLSKNDFIPKKTVSFNKIFDLIEMCDEFPIVYDIIWALSFNQDIQQQLRTNSAFMSKLVRQANDTDDEQMRKILQGICWNLNINQQTHSSASQVHSEADSFDVMISYSHKEKVLCKQIYDELVKANYRVWIDFDQMHGNVMDAMAQAIERSKIVILCMSEQYRKSSYCRAEAQYAFQQQRKIVPLLLQKHYKPDGWLLFLIGQLMYVDFTKYEFNRAMEMLHREMKMNSSSITKETAVEVTSNRSSSASMNILDWNAIEVRSWLLEHNLVQMARLLEHQDGRSLVYLHRYLKHGQTQQILTLLEEDSVHRMHQHLSLLELSQLQSLVDQQKRVARSYLSKLRRK